MAARLPLSVPSALPRKAYALAVQLILSPCSEAPSLK